MELTLSNGIKCSVVPHMHYRSQNTHTHGRTQTTGALKMNDSTHTEIDTKNLSYIFQAKSFVLT